MPLVKKQLKQKLALLLFSAVFLSAGGRAETDHGDHAKHADPSQEFHGVFYGFAPCEDCLGLKMTLSLNQRNNYLLVRQYAKAGSREIYEKGKYVWDDENRIVSLTPRKGKGIPRKFQIQDTESLLQLDENGNRMSGRDADRYVLRRSDTVKNREIHFH